MNIYYFLILLLFCLFQSPLVAQECNTTLDNHNHPTGEINVEKYSNSYIDKVKEYCEEDIQEIAHPHKKDFVEFYENRAERLSKMASKGHFYYDEDLMNTINGIGSKLVDANNIRDKERIRWVINRTGVPNASCVGEGTLIINLGLLTQLGNLDQLAFIMAHELGHYQLDHANKKLVKMIDFHNSDQLKKKIKKAGKDEAGSREELIDLLEQKSVSLSKHSREYESETDALGFEFYTKAGFPADQAVEAMKILKNIDLGKYTPPDLEKIFSNLDLEWKPTWIKTRLSGLSLIKPDEEEIEKYRTHPQTDERIENLIALGGTEKEDSLDPEWCEQSIHLDLEILEYTYWMGNKFRAFTLACQLHEINSENEYVKNLLGNLLADLTIARQEHYFSKIIPLPNIKMNDQSFLMATFLDNINFSSLKKLTTSWIKENIDLSSADNEALSALQIKVDILDEKDPSSRQTSFNKKWPESPYLYNY